MTPEPETYKTQEAQKVRSHEAPPQDDRSRDSRGRRHFCVAVCKYSTPGLQPL